MKFKTLSFHLVLFVLLIHFNSTGQKAHTLSMHKLPFAESMKELKNQDSIKLFHQKMVDAIYASTYVKDTLLGTLSDSSKWKFHSFYAHSQSGHYNQNQLYGESYCFKATDPSKTLSAAELIGAFSQDSAQSIDPRLHVHFTIPDQQQDRWCLVLMGDELLVKLFHSLAPKDPSDFFGINSFFHTEEYWYFFKRD